MYRSLSFLPLLSSKQVSKRSLIDCGGYVENRADLFCSGECRPTLEEFPEMSEIEGFDFYEYEENWDDICEKLFPSEPEQTEQESKMSQEPAFFRALDLQKLQAGSIFENVRGYGCWCSLDTGFTEGHGQPVDDHGLDAVCKQVNENLKCLVEDFKSEAKICDPYNVFYTFGSPVTGKAQGWDAACKQVNQMFYENPMMASFLGLDPADYKCAVRTCAIDSFFMSWLAESATRSPSFADYQYFQHDIYGGIFNPVDECTRYQGQKVEKKCCGLYPERRFQKQDSSLECVDDRALW